MLFCSLNAICSTAGDMFCPAEYLCQESSCSRQAEYSMFGLWRLLTTGLSWVFNIIPHPTQYSWKNKLSNPYRSLWESISLLQTASIWKGLSTPSLGSHHAPIVHSGHSLLLHFTWDTYHGALSRSVFKHQHLLCSPVLSVIVRNKQQTLSHGEQAMFWAQVHALWQ